MRREKGEKTMIKQCLVRFFRNLKYFFTPLGALFLGIVLGISLFLPIAAAAVKGLADDVAALSSNVSFDSEAFFEELLRCIAALDWSDPLGALGTAFSEDWLTFSLSSALESALSEEAQTFIQQTGALIDSAVEKIAAGAALFLFCALIGLFGGFFLTRFLIRRDAAKTALWKRALVSVIGAAAYALFVYAFVRLFSLWKPGVFIAVFAAVAVFEFFALTRAYFLHANKKMSFRKVVNFKNILLLFAANVLIQAIAFCLFLLAVWLTNALTGAAIAISLFEIAFFVIEVNAEAYVKDLCSLPLRPEKSALSR